MTTIVCAGVEKELRGLPFGYPALGEIAYALGEMVGATLMPRANYVLGSMLAPPGRFRL